MESKKEKCRQLLNRHCQTCHDKFDVKFLRVLMVLAQLMVDKDNRALITIAVANTLNTLKTIY